MEANAGDVRLAKAPGETAQGVEEGGGVVRVLGEAPGRVGLVVEEDDAHARLVRPRPQLHQGGWCNQVLAAPLGERRKGGD